MADQPNWNNLICDKSRVNNVSFLSKACVDGTDDGTLDCLPHEEIEVICRIVLGVWGIITIIIGVFGNVLTLVAIPYAAYKKR